MEASTVKKTPRGPAGTRAFYQIDTKGMCLLCMRERQVGKKNSKQISTQFCKMLFRYLKIDFHRNIVKPSNFKWKANKVKQVSIELCQDCTLLATSFNETYCQMELIQMRLNSYVKSISDIMRVAGRIPSRVKAYQERIGMASKVSPGNHMIGKSGLSAKAAIIAQTFRKELTQKSFESQRSALPRVKLCRTSNALSTHSPEELLIKSKVSSNKSANTNSVVIITTPLSPVQTQFRNFLIAYTFSFASVWLLAVLTGANMILGQNLSSLGSIEDSPVFETGESGSSSSEEPGNKAASSTAEGLPRNSLTITDSGKTVLLPHQTFKVDENFVDESIMEEDNTDLIDISDDGFFAQVNSLIDDVNMSAVDPVIPLQPETVKQEPQESILEVNDRTCTECRIHLSCRAELEKHRSLIHKWLSYVQCPVCKNMFSSYHFLKKHRLDSEACALDEATEALEFATIAKPLFPYSSTVRGNSFCPMEGCFEVFCKPENLQLHLKAHGVFSCSQGECKEKFEKAHDLALHECQQHSTGQFAGFKCTRCNFHVGGQYHYILHFLKEHLNINIFTEQCNICQKGFLSKGIHLSNDKEVHFRTHHDVNGKDPKSIIKCDINNCEAFFLKKLQLNAHKINVHHIEPEAKFSCSICGEKILNQSLMIKHKLQAHSNLPAHEIEAKLKRKLGVQVRKGKYKCMYCGNQYTTKYALLIHSKIHDEMKKIVVPEEEEKVEESHKQRDLTQLGESSAGAINEESTVEKD